MRSASYIALDAVSAAASAASAPIPATQLLYASAQIAVIGSAGATGSVSLQQSNDVAPGFPTESFVPTNWSTIATVAISGNGTYLVETDSFACQWLRVIYTNTGGTGGTLTAVFDGAGPSATGGGGIGTFVANGDLSGNDLSQTVIGIQTRPVASTAPSSGQVLGWNGSEWAPSTVSGFTAGGDLTGSSSSQTVVGLQGNSVSAALPVTNYPLVWNGTAWAPSTLAASVLSGTVGLANNSVEVSKTYQLASGFVSVIPSNGAAQYMNLNSFTTMIADFSGVGTAVSATVAVLVVTAGGNSVAFGGVDYWIGSNPGFIGSLAAGAYMLVLTSFNAGGTVKVVGSWQTLA